MTQVNYVHSVPNSHSFGSLKNIVSHYDLKPEEVTREYLIRGLKNTQLRDYEVSQFDEAINAGPIFPSIENMLKFLYKPDVNIELFIGILQNTLQNNIDLKSKRKMERNEIYKNIDSERDYQDSNWGSRREKDGTPDEQKPVSEWLNYIEYHINKAKARVYHLDTKGATAELRKIAALAVRGMEIHGCPERVPLLNYNPNEDTNCCGDCKCDK